jgi:predicted porin
MTTVLENRVNRRRFVGLGAEVWTIDFGRESGIGAVHEYLQNKTVWINTGAAVGIFFVMR